MPPLEGVWGQFLGALVVSHYVWFVGAVQVISGTLFLIGRYVPLAIALSGPVVANIIVYHLTMQHSGAQLAVLATICWVILFWHYRVLSKYLIALRRSRIVNSSDPGAARVLTVCRVLG